MQLQPLTKKSKPAAQSVVETHETAKDDDGTGREFCPRGFSKCGNRGYRIRLTSALFPGEVIDKLFLNYDEVSYYNVFILSSFD